MEPSASSRIVQANTSIASHHNNSHQSEKQIGMRILISRLGNGLGKFVGINPIPFYFQRKRIPWWGAKLGLN
jgi:hypothetical protein